MAGSIHYPTLVGVRSEHVPKGILPAGHLVVSLKQVEGVHVLRVLRPRGNGKYDLPPELLALMCLHLDTSDMIRPGDESKRCVGIDPTTKRHILIEVPLDEAKLEADPTLKTRWVTLGNTLVSRSYELYEAEQRRPTPPSSEGSKLDIGSLVSRSTRSDHGPIRVHAALRSTGPVSAQL